jgi:hypothetical protein
VLLTALAAPMVSMRDMTLLPSRRPLRLCARYSASWGAQLRAADKGNSGGPDVFSMMAADRQLEQDQEGAEPEPGVESDD